MTQRKHNQTIECQGCGRSFGIIQQAHVERCVELRQQGVRTRAEYKTRFGSTIAAGVSSILAGNIVAFNESMTATERSEHAARGRKAAVAAHPDLASMGGKVGAKGLWDKPGQKTRHAKRLRDMNAKGYMAQGPNKLEQKLWDLVGHDRLEFASFKFWKTIETDRGFSHITPDFKVIGAMAVVEVYGDYWHRFDNPQDRIDAWRSTGVDCIVVWESEIRSNTEAVKFKVIEFISRKLHERPAPRNQIAGGDIV